MLYTGSFYSIHKNKQYTVNIVTNGTQSLTSTFTCGPNPFVTSMDSEAETIYSPIKSSSATIEIVDSGYQFDLYSSTAKQNTVTLLDASNNVVWTGYTQPNAYSVPYDHDTETYTVEALDGLGVLQYYDFEAGGVLKTDSDGIKTYNKRFRTFSQIINDILTTAGCYTNWYFSKNTKVYGSSNTSIETDISVSEANFFDEDDKPMTMYEVLTEICKFTGTTAIAKGSSVYFLDYDAIKNGVNTYSCHTVGSDSYTTVTVSDSKNISSTDFTQTGSTLSLDNTYSKVTVKDSLYTVDDLLPDIFDDDNLENITESNHYWNSMDTFCNQYITIDKNGWQEFWGESDEYKWVYEAAKWYKPTKHWINHYYNNSGTAVSDPSVMTGHIAKNYIGCTPARFHVNMDQESESDAKKGVLDFSDYLCFHQNRKTANSLCLLENDTDESPKFFFPSNAKLLFSGDMLFSICTYNDVWNGSDDPDFPYFPAESDTGVCNQKVDGKHDFMFGSTKNEVYYKFSGGWSKWSMTGDVGFIRFSLKFGDKYLNDLSGSSWSTTEKILKIPVTITADDIIKPITSNVTVTDGVDEEGYCISLPATSGDCFAAVPKLKIYGFPSFMYVGTSVIFLKDFKLQVKVPMEATTDERVTDTEYSYEIDANYINELSPIEFKICTWDDKDVNYSTAVYGSSTYNFVDKLVNTALNQTERSENLMCYKIARQYQTPSKKLTLNLFNNIQPYTLVTDSNISCTMIVDSMNVDYVNDSVELNLIEKK